MPYTFEQSKDEIARLVKHFAVNLDQYLAPAYKEAHARQEFIDPLFGLLNWDVHNRQHAAPDYREVVVEDSLDIEGQKKAPDYAFRVGRERKFFVEAKKPGVDLKNAAGPAYQLRRYAWSAKLPLSILTDFEELVVYDCRIRPAAKDKSSAARLNYLKCVEYADRWQELWDVYSRDAVLGGSFDQYAQSGKGKRGASEVDAEFLKEIEGWRDTLARNIALRNPRLTIDEMNNAVQRTIDRIIFLRMAEDRGIESYGRLQRLAEGGNIYADLLTLFRLADDRYNSGLFDFSKSGDRITPALTLDDKALKPILANLYYPQSPYEFSVLPVEILGNVYEQFLGKVIRLTATHQAKVEEKPEVKKAGGVFYTPAYIVEYNVKNTVGKQVQGKSPAQLKGFRVLDMACGSGSFLLGAFQYLLDYYRQWYSDNAPEKHADAVWRQGESWRLTTVEKKRILIEHIFGVDIDRQAVEVTKLSLLLKVLEGESDESLGRQLALFHERALPNLDRNIKCGNSLIGNDYFAGQLLPDDDELKRVNPFDWKTQFPEAMQAGGFDCIIGNPPYVRQEILGEGFKAYAKIKFVTYAGTADMYVYFIEQAARLLRLGGQLGFIVASKWLRVNYGEPLRKWLKTQCVDEIVDFGALPVFRAATTYTCILRISNCSPRAVFEATQVHTLNFRNLSEYVQTHHYSISQPALENQGWSLANVNKQALIAKLRSIGVSLDAYVKGQVYYGIKTGYNDAFVIDCAMQNSLTSADQKNLEIIKPFLIGRDIKRYQTPASDRYLIFTRHGTNIKSYPTIEQYLLQFKQRLTPKPKNWKGSIWKGRKSGAYQWYEIQDAVDYYAKFSRPKILWPGISAEVTAFTLDEMGYYGNDNTQLIISGDQYLLGILNSSLSRFLLVNICDQVQGGFYRLKIAYIEQLPIRPINFSDPADKTRHDKMVTLVEQMLDLHRRKAAADAAAQERVQRLIDATDRQIDALVYELYDLTPEEIAVVENAGR